MTDILPISVQLQTKMKLLFPILKTILS